MVHRTLIDIFEAAVARPRPDLLLYKEGGSYKALSSEVIAARVRQLACFLAGLGVGRGDRVAILSENRPEWTISDFAVQSLGAIDVPIYTTLSPEQIGHLLRDARPAVALVSARHLVERLVLAAAGQEILKHLVIFDRWQGFPKLASSAGEIVFESGVTAGQFRVALRRWIVALPTSDAGPAEGAINATFLEEAYARGAHEDRQRPGEFESRRALVEPEDVATLIYTSGTTGDPKGAMLTHSNFCSNVDTCLGLIPFDERDVALSFLPLSHVFERLAEYAYLAAGASIAFAESIDAMAANILEVRPTVVSSVPRLFEKIHARVLETVRASSRLRRRIVEMSLNAGRERLRHVLAGRPVPPLTRLKFAIADRFVFSQLRDRMGGRLRFFISGGAPLPVEVEEFFLAAGITILEGYGLTETSPVIAINTFDHLRPGTVGRVIPGVEVRIAEDGEILVRGPNVMKGYYAREDQTREAIRDGFFATGDIGAIDADGFLRITDRKKDLLITSGGKNIAPQPIENALKTSRYIANAVLIGDRRNFIAALIVPDFEALTGYAERLGLGRLAPAELVRRAEIVDLIAVEIEAATTRFASFERVRKFALLERDFTQEDGEITPTLKVRRRVINERYKDRIERLYES